MAGIISKMKGSILQKDTTISNAYASTTECQSTWNRNWKYCWWEQMNPFLQLDNSKSSYPSWTDPEMQNIHENTGERTSITHPPHPLHIGRILHSTMRYRHSARADMKQSLREPKFGAIQHMWTTKGIEITGTMLSDPSWLKLEIENRKIAGEMTREREIQQPTSKEDMGGRAGGWRDGWRRWRERRVHFFCWALRNVQNCGVMLYTWNSHYTVCQLCLNLKKRTYGSRRHFNRNLKLHQSRW